MSQVLLLFIYFPNYFLPFTYPKYIPLTYLYQLLVGQLIESRLANDTPIENNTNNKKKKSRGIKKFMCGLA